VCVLAVNFVVFYSDENCLSRIEIFGLQQARRLWRYSLKLKVKEKQNSNVFAVVLLFNNKSLPYSRPLLRAFTPPSLVPRLWYRGYICLPVGVHLRLAIEDKYIFSYLLFPNIYTYISGSYFQKSFYTYC